MTNQISSSFDGHRTKIIVAFVFVSFLVLWYVRGIYLFGFPTGIFLDSVGIYFIFNWIILVKLMITNSKKVSENRLFFFAGALAIPASILFFGQFLSTFDPFYNVNSQPYSYFIRALFLIASVTTLFAIEPKRFFTFPLWLFVPVCLITAGWIFVYCCPSIIREWYGTRSAPSEFFPSGLLMFDRANPERNIQHQMLFTAAIAWLVLIVVGWILHRKLIVKETIFKQEIVVLSEFPNIEGSLNQNATENIADNPPSLIHQESAVKDFSKTEGVSLLKKCPYCGTNGIIPMSGNQCPNCKKLLG